MSNYLSPSQDGGKKRTNQLNDKQKEKRDEHPHDPRWHGASHQGLCFPLSLHLSFDCSPSPEIKVLIHHGMASRRGFTLSILISGNSRMGMRQRACMCV